MIEKILPNLYRVEVPLPQNPLKAVNSYVVKAADRSLVIDTGMNREESLRVLSSDLKELGIDFNKTDFFVTHLHADHLGLVSSFATATSVVYFNQEDAAIYNSIGYWEKVYDFARLNGVPADVLGWVIENNPAIEYSSKGHLDFHILKEGETIGIGDYLFRCIKTPGHSMGHTCLYEPSKRLFISGDHILGDITPNITLWSDNRDPLREYLESLDKVYDLNVELVLPGHRGTFKDYRGRIQELKEHHETRANEVVAILEKGSKNAYQVASQMSWDMTYESWELFPTSQKWFATGEAITHLKYLEERGKLRREIQKQGVVFSVK